MNKPKKAKRIFLSPPHMGGEEQRFIQEALESNYIAPLGPQVDAFEREFAQKVGIEHTVAVSSGTAAMHLALRVLGVGPGDKVVTSAYTFTASAEVIRYLGADPVFVDINPKTFNLDPKSLDRCLSSLGDKAR